MTTFNGSDFNIKQGEKSLHSSSAITDNESYHIMSHQITNSTGYNNNFCGYAMNYEKPKDDISFQDNEAFFRKPHLNKRYRRSLDQGICEANLQNYRNQYQKSNFTRGSSAFNGSEMKSSYINFRKMNSYQEWEAQAMNNAKKLLIDPFSVNGSVNKALYTNGVHATKPKASNSYGTSYLFHPRPTPHPPSVPSSAANHMYSHSTNEFHSLPNVMRSNDLASFHNLNGNDLHNNDMNGFDAKPVSDHLNYTSNEPVRFYDISSLGYRNNKIVERKDSIPECEEPDLRHCAVDGSFDHGLMETLVDSYPMNNPPLINRDDPSIPILTDHRHSIPFSTQPLPMFFFSNNGAADSRSINIPPQFRFAYPDNNITATNSNPTDNGDNNVQNMDVFKGYLLQSNELSNGTEFFYPQVVHESHSVSSVTDMPVDVGQSVPPSPSEPGPSRQPSVDHQPLISNHGDSETRTVGKFTITTSRDIEASVPPNPDIATIEPAQLTSEAPVGRNMAHSNQTPRSRFKKTRIKETVERWQINGISSYDCRFKVIPTKIMELQGKNPDQLSKDFEENLCQNCGDHDVGYRCPSSKVYGKEFLFWNTGERLSILGKSDYDTENYCQFHAKYLKLLNQNQNLSLSKFDPQYINDPSSTMFPSPQMIGMVFVTSTDNQILNAETHISQNDAFSAPPASPSLLSSNVDFNPFNQPPGTPFVVLRCQTPILVNESMLMRHRSSSKMSSESDSTSIMGQAMFLNSPTNRDNIAFTMVPKSFSNCTEGVDGRLTNETSVAWGQMSQIYCSMPQPVVPTMSHTTTDTQAFHHNPTHTIVHNNCPISASAMQEIDNSLAGMKQSIVQWVMGEQEPLVSQMRSLTMDNEHLRAEVCRLRQRSEYLESVLREHNIVIDRSPGPTTPSLATDHQGHSSMPDLVLEGDPGPARHSLT